MLPLNRGTALAALFAVVLTASITASFRLPSPDTLPRCLSSALLAFQTAQSPQEATAVWNDLREKAPNLAKQQYADYALIAAYLLFFLILGRIGRHRPIMSSRIAGTLTIILALITALADIAENWFTLANITALQQGLPGTAQVAEMRNITLTKWAACGLTLALVGWIVLPSRRGSALYRLLALTIAALSIISGAMGVLGFWDNPKIELVFPFLGPALLLIVPLFWRYWDDVLGTHVAVHAQPIEAWEVSGV
jgi:hypothetical protein